MNTFKTAISTWRDNGTWYACFGDYDVGSKVYGGKTEREAIDDLLDAHTTNSGQVETGL